MNNRSSAEVLWSWSEFGKLSDKISISVSFRLVHSGPGKSSSGQESDLTFGLRLGTKHGVETHLFRVDTAKELSTWSHLLVEGCHTAAELIQEVTTGTSMQLSHTGFSFEILTHCIMLTMLSSFQCITEKCFVYLNIRKQI